jgi:glycosyltransferase involved in cell wall biosynthesis
MHEGGDPLNPQVHYHHLKVPAPWGYFLNMFALKKMIKKIKPDLVHVHYVTGYGTLGSLSGFQPRIVSVWGSDIFNFPLISFFNEALVRWNVKRGAWIGSTSYIMAHQTLKVVPEAQGKISVTPFGIDLEKFTPRPELKDPDRIIIGSVKTLDFKYGIDVLIRGFAALLARLETEGRFELIDKLELQIAGQGTLESRLRDIVRDFKIETKVKFLGQIPHDQVPNVLNRFDIYSAPSREDSESFGVAIVEASSCEVPVVVTRVGGLQEVVLDGITGLIVEKDSVSELAAAFYKLIMDKDLRIKMGKAGRLHVTSLYNWPSNVSRMEWLYLTGIRRYRRSK